MIKDRKDGKYVKINEPLGAIMPYIFDKRTEAEVYTKEELDVTELMQWLEKQNKKLDYKMTPFHAISSVFVKTVYNRPLLNSLSKVIEFMIEMMFLFLLLQKIKKMIILKIWWLWWKLIQKKML